MFKGRRLESGFNLVELMVVVAIIGILTSFAMPKFATFKARAAQTEARTGLNGIFLSVQAFETTNGTLPPAVASANPTTAGIGFTITGNQPKYRYVFTSVPASPAWAATAYSSLPGSATAKALANGFTDKQRINGNKWLCAPFDAVSGVPATAQATGQVSTGPTNCPETVAGTVGAFNPTMTAADTM